jgi:hypothetical protein
VKHKHRVLKVVTLSVLILIGLAFGAFFMVMHLVWSFDPAGVPKITANPVEANQVFSVSQFRSGSGHDYSYGAWDGETCRSMKHYFNYSQNNVNNQPVRSQPGPGESNIMIYAPFDSTIKSITAEHTPIGKQVRLVSAKNQAYYVRLFHIDLLPGLKVGSKVSSGQQIGTIGPKDGTDVSYEANYRFGKTIYLSIFDYMTPAAFAPYADLGKKPSDFVLSRQQADQNHYSCNGEQFTQQQTGTNGGTPPGYVSLRPNPYASAEQSSHNNECSLPIDQRPPGCSH